MKLLVDQMWPAVLAEQLRRRGHDVIAVLEREDLLHTEDDAVFEAARREAVEETGVSAFEAPIGPRILDVDVHPIPASVDRPAHVHFDLRHLLTTGQERVDVQSSEVRAARWFTFDEALAAGADGSLARALRKALAVLRGRT